MEDISVAVQGVTGRMGTEVINVLCKDAGLRAVGAIQRSLKDALFSLPDGLGEIPMSTDVVDILEATNPQVLVDFTNADVLVRTAPIIAAQGVNIVTGTSGLNDRDLAGLDKLAMKHGIGIVVAPNFALGAAVLQYLATQAAEYFDYVDLIEMHHERKIDAPSGTALAIAKAISERKKFRRNIPEKETLTGTRGGDYNGVSIHSVRSPGTSANHEIIFSAAGQTLILRHDTIGRECYMPGVTMAIRHVVKNTGLVVGLDKILGLGA